MHLPVQNLVPKTASNPVSTHSQNTLEKAIRPLVFEPYRVLAHRNPTFEAELSGVFELRAATRYRLQYDL